MYGSMSYSKHELLVRLLIVEYRREALSGYNKLTLDQIWRADKEAFKCLAKECRARVRTKGVGPRTLDETMDKMLKDPSFGLLLVQLLAMNHDVPKGDERQAQSFGDSDDSKRLRRLEQRMLDFKTRKFQPPGPSEVRFQQGWWQGQERKSQGQ